MTQKQLIIEYIKEHGSIVPAKEHGFPFKGGFLGSESSKRCRELRKDGILRSERDGKFERFYLSLNKDFCVNCHYFMNHAKDCESLVREQKEILTLF